MCQERFCLIEVDNVIWLDEEYVKTSIVPNIIRIDNEVTAKPAINNTKDELQDQWTQDY